jgi:hypothetical protein
MASAGDQLDARAEVRQRRGEALLRRRVVRLHRQRALEPLRGFRQ